MSKEATCATQAPSTTDEIDAKLIKATLQGDPSSFGELIRLHQPAIFAMIHRQVRHREEAEDVTQQVFMKAYQHLAKFRGESRFFTWLYSIALNLVRNHVRYRNIRRTSSLDGSDNTEEGRQIQYADTAPAPDDVVHSRWEMARVVLALESVGEPLRTIFTLHYFQHLPLKDVAKQIGRPVGTVKVYLHRARKMILLHMEKK